MLREHATPAWVYLGGLTLALTAGAINAVLRQPAAQASDSATVRLNLPAGYPGGMVALLGQIEQLTVEPDQPARVVIPMGRIAMGRRTGSIPRTPSSTSACIRDSPPRWSLCRRISRIMITDDVSTTLVGASAAK